MARDGVLETLGDLMRQAREAAGYSLTRAAQEAKTSKSHLSHVERGRDRPSRDLVAFYEETFQADQQIWTTYLDTLATPRTRALPVAKDGTCYPLPGDASEFVADITVPDGTVMPPGYEFEKIWRIRNAGTVPWIGRWLARVGAPTGHGAPQSPLRVRVPDTEPGGVVDLVVPLRAHPLDGTAQVHWKMVDDDGREYFPQYPQGIILTIVVREAASAPILRRLEDYRADHESRRPQS